MSEQYIYTIQTRDGEIRRFVADSPEFTVEINGVPMCGVLHDEVHSELWIGHYHDGEQWEPLSPVCEEPEGLPTAEQSIPAPIVHELTTVDPTNDKEDS